jgi:PKD repeat protein
VSNSISTKVEALTVGLRSSDNDNRICAGETVVFTATAPAASFFEFFLDGISRQSGTANQFTTNSLSNGQSVWVIASTASGCTANSNSVATTVEVISVNLISSDSDNSICAGETVTFTAHAPTATNYEFFINGVSVQNSATNLYTTAALTNGQNVTVRVRNAYGCWIQSSGITTTVNSLPTVTLVSSDQDNIICRGEGVTFTASSAIAITFDFFVNGTSVQSGLSNTYTSTGLTNGETVTVRVSTASGCSVLSSGITTTVNDLPLVSLSSSDADNSICAGEQVTFSANSASASNYKFFINGTLVQDGAFPTYTSTGLTNGETVTVRVSTASGCSVLSSGITTTVNDLPLVSLSSSDADNSICAGEQVTFTAHAPTATNYEFFINGVSVQNSATNLYTTAALSNGQTVTVRASTASGCTALSTGIRTTVNALPIVSLSSSDADNSICAGEQLTFTASSPTATSFEFFVDGISAQLSASNKYITNSLTNGQVVRVVATTDAACQAVSSSISTLVNALPAVNLSSSDTDNIICSGEQVTFTAASSTAVNYEFFINGVSVQNSASNKYTASTLTNGQTISVRVTTASGCSAESSGIIMQVNPLVTVSAGGDQTVCEGVSAVLSGWSSLEGKPVTVTWSGGSGTFDDIHLPNATYTPAVGEAGKTVTLTLTTSDPDGTGPCTEAVDQVRITINALPAVLFSGLNNSYCIAASGSELTGFPAGGTFTGQGISGNTSGQSFFNPAVAGAGTHIIRYTYTDASSCTNFYERSVTVYPLPAVSYSGFNNSGPRGTAQYSQDALAVSLAGFPAGGTFSGKGISGNIFSASAAGPGTHIIRYTYGDEYGCINFQEQTVTVLPLPDVGIGNMPDYFCSEDPDFVMTGTPSGGTFSGPGVIAGTSVFRSSNAFIGSNIIRYTYKDPVTGGTNFIEKTVIVYKVPDVTFSGLNSSYCVDAAHALLSGFPADNDGPGGVTGVFQGPGIYFDNQNGTYFFNPSAAGVGTHRITYVFTNENGCTNSTSKQVNVFELPMVTFSGLENAYCVDASAASLVGFPSNGMFSGPGMSGSTFIPSLASPGVHTVTYTFTNANGCTSTQQQQVRVYAVPVADFRFEDVCDKDQVRFTDLTPAPLSGSIVSWEWNFGDPVSGSSNTSTLQHPVHRFTAPGTYNVSFKVTTEYGCENTKVVAVTIGGIPKPDFTWSDICLGESVIFQHQYALTTGTITEWHWSFGDSAEGNYTSSTDPVTHRYATPGRYNVTLTVFTDFGCASSITKAIYILPSVRTYPYLENFETTDGGWMKDGIRSSWQHGIPAGNTINTAASGSNAWITGLSSGYNANENSYVYSPCFDFSSLRKPMVSLNIWNHTQQGFDGAVLQSSVDGGLTWQNVGTIGEGINWYNQSAIIGNPGNQAIGQNGWSGTETGWLNAMMYTSEKGIELFYLNISPTHQVRKLIRRMCLSMICLKIQMK